MKNKKIRNLVLALGDQLNLDSEAFKGFDKNQDAVAMAEVLNESKVVWSHKMRTSVFLSGMRHFALKLKEEKITLFYEEITSDFSYKNFYDAFKEIIKKTKPEKLILVEPGEVRVLEELKTLAKDLNLLLELRRDHYFLSSIADFREFSQGKKQIRMEFFYREMRRKYSILMDGKNPIGGEWNYDDENRKSFKKDGPPKIPLLKQKPDKLTHDVINLVEDVFKDHPGKTEEFNWPVTSEEALEVLTYFIKNLLPEFGQWQDAMWTKEAFLYHSRLSVALNLKLIHPLKVIQEAEKAYQKGKAPLSSVEGFIRQILGWREYVRGVYFTLMPEYLERNFLGAKEPLPEFYWNANTEMNCLKDVITQTLEYGYAHHIQRLMVTGLFSLLYGVHPKEIHQWYLAVYVDALEWVELPNTLGMSQYADGGVMASKPYIASGKYISRMSNYCKGCRFNPDESTGDEACPFTTFYWDFVRKHKTMLAKNPRLGMQVKNWDKLDKKKQNEIEAQATLYRKKIAKGNL